MTLVSLSYLAIVIIYLVMGAAIIFHMLYYRINRRVSVVMFFIYSAGGIFLLVSNFFLWRSVDWYQIFSTSGL